GKGGSGGRHGHSEDGAACRRGKSAARMSWWRASQWSELREARGNRVREEPVIKLTSDWRTRGASSMSEEQDRRHAEGLALAMGITFYVVRSAEGKCLAVQRPSDDCEVLATVAPPDSVQSDSENVS